MCCLTSVAAEPYVSPGCCPAAMTLALHACMHSVSFSFFILIRMVCVCVCTVSLLMLEVQQPVVKCLGKVQTRYCWCAINSVCVAVLIPATILIVHSYLASLIAAVCARALLMGCRRSLHCSLKPLQIALFHPTGVCMHGQSLGMPHSVRVVGSVLSRCDAVILRDR